MASTKVKRKLLWDAWKLTPESLPEVLSELNSKVTVIASTDDSITIRNEGEVEDLIITVNQWVLIPEGINSVSVLSDETFLDKFEVVAS